MTLVHYTITTLHYTITTLHCTTLHYTTLHYNYTTLHYTITTLHYTTLQEFLGDIMFSNTYMTQRIPANWEDPEKEEMSDTYLSTGTMAWPGDEETDYNFKLSAWEELSLPFGPEYHPSEDSMMYRHEKHFEGLSSPEVEEDPEGSEKGPGEVGGDVDWATFDFTGTSQDTAEIDAQTEEFSGATTTPEPEDPNAEIDDFFKSFEKDSSSSSINSPNQGPTTAGSLDIMDSDLASKARRGNQESRLTQRLPQWKTPPEWLTEEENMECVPFETWSKNDKQWFEDTDDEVWDEDVFFAQSMSHVMRVTDIYLHDHTLQNKQNDEAKYWDKVVYGAVTGEDVVKDPIPIYLTPDIDRGVVYSDELVEMKGKLTLHPFQEEPAKAYENDTFAHNQNMSYMNMVGSTRDQYDWLPDESLLPYVIEEGKLDAIAPVMAYVNHAATLLSTKDDVLVFRYKGNMRHLLGIRG